MIFGIPWWALYLVGSMWGVLTAIRKVEDKPAEWRKTLAEIPWSERAVMLLTLGMAALLWPLIAYFKTRNRITKKKS